MGGGVLLTSVLSVAALWTLAEGQREQIEVPTRAYHLGIFAKNASVDLRGLQWYSQAEYDKEAYVSAHIPARRGLAGYILAEFEVAESIEMRSGLLSPRPFLVATPTNMSTGGPASGAPAVPRYRVTDEGNFEYFDTDATPSLQQDEEGFWTQKRYHYLVLNASLPWTLFMLNFNLNPRIISGDNPHLLNGTLHVSFLDGAQNDPPCPRGTAMLPCSSRGNCDKGKCECRASWAGRFCEEPVVKLTNVHQEGLYKATASIRAFSAVHFRFKVACERNAGDSCSDLLTDVLRGNGAQLALMRKNAYQPCPKSGKLANGTETNEFFVDRICFQMPLDTQQPFHARQDEVLYFSVYNDSNTTVPNVSLQVQTCGEEGCDYSGGNLVTIFLLCNFLAFLLPTIAVVCWKRRHRRRRGSSGHQMPGLSKRQINLMFPEETYKTSATLAETVSEPGDDSECIVCLSEYEDGDLIRRLPCGHRYHARCLDQWIVRSATCPRCRQPAEAPTTTTV